MCGSKICEESNAGSGCMRCPNPHTPGCTEDSLTFHGETQSLGEDALFVVDTNGVSVGLTYETPKPFPFTCSGPAGLLEGLSNETKGMLGLADTTTSLHALNYFFACTIVKTI
ncbi:hypothetical protein POM88_038038 [Heracleum sosnowskyi]|uniref:Uncharacterized protein n=1 Tax=Heracleum sosnowskyi TaxID=360622 RepID=A0AAD8HRM6_9APIA|nr:hypothetical protein POM88_038038 [Heracleum sosnowskyi]